MLRSKSRRLAIAVAAGAVVVALVVAPELALADVEDVPDNVEKFGLSVVSTLLVLALAGVSVFLFFKKQWTQLVVVLAMGMLVAWLAMSPQEAANQGRDFVSGLFGGN